MAVRLRYRQYIQSAVWKARSGKIKADVQGKCSRCGKAGTLHTHHKTYARLGHEKDGDLIALCAVCHAKEHGIYDEDAMLDFNTRKPGARLVHLLDTAIQAERAEDTPRAYLGASRVGESCLRMLQYEYFNTPKDTPFPGQTLRIFHRGHEAEQWMIVWLRNAGFDLRTEKEGGGQFGFSAVEGKLRGHADGVFVGGPEEFGPWPRLWECKCLGAKGFGKLEKEGLKKAYPVYYAQVQLYMAYFQLTDNPALFTALNANDMDVYAESVVFDGAHAQAMSDRAVTVLAACAAGELLPRVAQREDWYECKYCAYRERCWNDGRA
jgi:hypothetical protein